MSHFVGFPHSETKSTETIPSLVIRAVPLRGVNRNSRKVPECALR